MTNRIFAAVIFWVLLVAASGCTFLNKETFEIQSKESNKQELVLRSVEEYFHGAGLRMERKTEYFFPEKRKLTTYFLGQSRGPSPLYSSYSYLTLRLEPSNTVYIDWIKISDLREKARPGEFDLIHRKIADDLLSRAATQVTFRHIEGD